MTFSTNNMEYSLAKKLKDAGFPQTEDTYCRCSFLSDEQKDGTPVIYDCNTHWQRVSKPTLEELIEACGEKFVSLAQITKGEWQAVGPYKDKEQTYRIIINFNATPKIAVAHLYLALHAK